MCRADNDVVCSNSRDKFSDSVSKHRRKAQDIDPHNRNCRLTILKHHHAGRQVASSFCDGIRFPNTSGNWQQWVWRDDALGSRGSKLTSRRHHRSARTQANYGDPHQYETTINSHWISAFLGGLGFENRRVNDAMDSSHNFMMIITTTQPENVIQNRPGMHPGPRLYRRHESRLLRAPSCLAEVILRGSTLNPSGAIK
jgi:hypothetical protein